MKKKTNPESHRICNLVPSKNTEKDWGFHSAVAAGALGAEAPLPASVDLRATWWTIGNQESTGSCVGWASADGVLRYHLVKAGKLSKTEKLSPRFVWMSSKETDEFVNRPETFIESAGTSLKAAMDICRKYGVALESEVPFHINTTMYLGDPDSLFAGAAQRRSQTYHNLGKNLDEWRKWLARSGPILAGLSVDSTWDNAASTDGKLDTYFPESQRGGHAICVVGYTEDGRFIIRNSWDKTWGDSGFGFATEDYINDGFFDESYGVTL